ncbi:hypothetical protein ACFQ5D_12425 [Paenibacillus farraposensis]|uniref:Major facilitator superfamily (MFS) profile domain-containing protein n=1 Tax=Paenibacillus farraposensis TaxID=2807095 RepID=A0ABW4DEG9_9BACL
MGMLPLGILSDRWGRKKVLMSVGVAGGLVGFFSKKRVLAA